MWKENSNKLKWRNWHNTITVGGFNTPLTSVNNPRRKYNNAAAVLNKIKGEVYKNTGLPQETRKFWNKQTNFIHKVTGERTCGA